MKFTPRIFRRLVALGSMLAVTAFCQTTYVWTNQNPGHLAGPGDFNQVTNWSPNSVPDPMTGPDSNGVSGDLALFAGLTAGPLSITESGGIAVGFGGRSYAAGLRIQLTSNQTSSVTIQSPVSISAGMRMNYFLIDAGAGGLILGDHSVNVLDILAGEINGQIFGLTNNSSTPSVINETVRWRQGGAGAHPYILGGIGDWIVNNHMRSANSSAVLIQKEGPGTMTWTGTNAGSRTPNWFDPLGSPVRINGGTMILKSSDCIDSDAGGPAIIHNATLLKWDVTPAPGIVTTPATVPGNISGSGSIQVNAGTLTLSGQNTITGNWTLSGGELIAGSVESVGLSGPLGVGGTISFNGGTLGFGPTNAFDYSPRFSAAGGQAYSIDTGGQNVTFGTALSSVGGSLTKLGGGTLTLSGTSSYDGLTTINLGTLTFRGFKTGTGNILVADFGTLGVFENGTTVTPATLTLGTSQGCILEFNNVTNTTTAPLAAGTLSSAGNVTININSDSFTAISQSFPLLSWTNGSAPRVFLGAVNGSGGFLITNGNTIQFIVTSVPLVWTGTSNSNWSNPANWTTPYSDSKPVLFDDTAAGTTSVAVDVSVHPTSVTVNNSTKAYSITSGGANNIAGGTGLTKTGGGTLTLSGGANTYTGVTTVSGGILNVAALANGGSPSDIGAASAVANNIVLNCGTLRYAGPGVGINRLFSIGPGGGTIDSEGAAALVFNSSGPLGMSGEGPRTLTLTGPNDFGDMIASAIVNHPAGTSLRKEGAGTWTLTGTNTYGGVTIIANGVLRVGAGGNAGSLGSGIVSNNSALGFNRSGTLIVSGPVRGTGSVTIDGPGTVILANDNSYSGGTTINAGTLQVGNGGGSGSLLQGGPILNNSLLIFNTSGTFTYGAGAAGIISGIGNVIVQGGGFIKAIGNNTYEGWTRIDANTTFQPRQGQDGTLISSVVTNNGTLRLVSQDALFTYPGPIVGTGRVQIGANAVNFGVITLTGTNTYSGGTFIGGNTLVLGDGVTPISGSIAGNVQFVNNFTLGQDNARTLIFNRPDDFTFSGTITTNFTSPQANLGVVQQNGSGRLTLTGNNTYGGGTIFNAGALVIGNGGTNGSVGFGPVTLNSGAPLVINRSGNLTISGNINGAADLLLKGGATVMLDGANNTYAGSTTVSNGTLIVNGTNITSSTIVYAGGLGGKGTFTGPVTLQPGTTLSPGASVGTLTINGSLTIGGNLAIEVNKSLSPSNDFVVVTGVLTNTGTGILSVANLGPALSVGDKFTLFSKPLQNGAALTVVGLGANWINNLALDGSVTVSSFVVSPTLNFIRSTANSVQFSWSGSFKLQAQTNSVGVGFGTNWADYSGGSTSGITVPIATTNGTVFFRLISTP
jgi:fibronectin-binding autotransporter adhesin